MSGFGVILVAFRLNTERYRVSPRIQTECDKIRTRITANTDTFHAVMLDIYNGAFFAEINMQTLHNDDYRCQVSNQNFI